MELLQTILVIVSVFIIWVLATALVCKCSIQESTKVCKKICAEIFNALIEPPPPPQVIYPVCIGWDGNRILPQLVDAEFSNVRKNFTVCYCVNVNFFKDNCVIKYTFEILRKPETMDDESLQQIIQKQAEEIVAGTMRCYDCYVSPEPLTHVEIYRNKMYIGLARNAEGIKILDNRKKQLRRRAIETANTNSNKMTEDWEHGGKV